MLLHKSTNKSTSLCNSSKHDGYQNVGSIASNNQYNINVENKTDPTQISPEKLHLERLFFTKKII